MPTRATEPNGAETTSEDAPDEVCSITLIRKVVP